MIILDETTIMLVFLVASSILSMVNLTAIAFQHKKSFKLHKTEKLTVSNVSVCPECNQPGTHLATCSLRSTAKASEAKPHVAHNLIRGCTICGEKGHYAKKCPNKEKQQK